MLYHAVILVLTWALVSSPVPSEALTAKSTVDPASSTTCRSTSVNYITQTLPQQCLNKSFTSTSRAGSNEVSSYSSSNTPTSTLSSSSTQSADQILSELGKLSATTIQHGDQTPPDSSDTASTPSTRNGQDDTELESPLDNAKFVSFEEWKRQNIPPDAAVMDAGKGGITNTEIRQERPGNINALDGLGEDGEINIDFGGFGGSALPTRRFDNKVDSVDAHLAGPELELARRKRKTPAGTTSKERFNYASFDCAAGVLKTNSKCKQPSAILVENKDSYMLNECSMDNKFLIVELCEDIKIDTVVLANFEFFSSMFRTFRVSVSDRYPVKIDKWKELGTFEARNTRDIQAFSIEEPIEFVRYLRIELLTHYGSEYYCPLSLLRVHGVTMMDEYRREVLSPGDGDDEDEEDLPTISISEKDAKDTEVPSPLENPTISENFVSQKSTGAASPEITYTASTALPISAAAGIYGTVSPNSRAILALHDVLWDVVNTAGVCLPEEEARERSKLTLVPAVSSSEPTILSSGDVHVTQITESLASAPSSTSQVSISAVAPAASTIISSELTTTADSFSTSASASMVSNKNGTDVQQNNEGTSQEYQQNTDTTILPPSSSSISTGTPSVSQQSSSSTHIPQPTSQDSFFKSIHKRLQALESNATLSLQYIEAQSALLRDAFAQVEKRQLTKTNTFLESLNATVLTEMKRLKDDYEQLWQSTVLELSNQREEGRREREMLGERVRALAEEMISQKRIMAAQATILLLCLGLVVFARLGGSSGAGFDSGLRLGLQQAVGSRRASAMGSGKVARAKSWSPWATPSRRNTPLNVQRQDGKPPRSEDEDDTDLRRGHKASPSHESVVGESDLALPRTPESSVPSLTGSPVKAHFEEQ